MKRRAAIALAILAGVALLVLLWLRNRGASELDGGAEVAVPARLPAGMTGHDWRALQAPPAPAMVLPLRGRVVTPDGAPVAGATVQLVSRPRMTARMRDSLTEVPSKDDGTFEFKALPVGRYLVEARRDDAVSSTAAVEHASGREPVVLVLRPGTGLEVFVYDAETGRPLSDAEVHVDVGDSDFGESETSRSARTGADGIVRFRGLLPDGAYAVAVHGPAGYTDELVAVHPWNRTVGSGWDVRVGLLRAAVAAGRVVNEEGEPIAGAQVGSASPLEDHPELFLQFPGNGKYGTERTDAEGRFSLSLLPGAPCVRAAHPLYRVGEACGVSQGRTGLEIVLRRGATIRGTVVDAEGSLVPGASVIVTQRGWTHNKTFDRSYRFSTETDLDGAFRFTGLRNIPVAIYAWTGDAASDLVDVDLSKIDAVHDVVVRLEYTGVITGEVVEGDGEPVAGAVVEYFAQPELGPPLAAGKPQPRTRAQELAEAPVASMVKAYGAVSTGLDGKFRIEGLAPGLYGLNARRPGVEAVPPAYTLTQELGIAPGEHAVLTLRGLGSISGRVRTRGGRRIPYFEVRVSTIPIRDEGGSPVPAVPVRGGDGSFLIENIPEGIYHVTFSGPDIVRSRRYPVEVKAGEETRLGDMEVDQGASRRGVVRSASGEPVPEALVTLAGSADARTWLKFESEEDGSFPIPAVPDNLTILVRAESEDLRASSGWVQVPPDVPMPEVVLTQVGEGALVGELVDPSAPVEDRVVLLTYPGDGVPGEGLDAKATTRTLEGGRFQMPEVRAGDYLLWVRRYSPHRTTGGDEWHLHPEPVVIVPGRESRVRIQVSPEEAAAGSPSRQR